MEPVNLPMEDGSQLWEVYLSAHYYDNNPWMPGNVPVDERVYVIAKSEEEAKQRADLELKARIKGLKLSKHSIRVNARPMPLEFLIPSRDTSGQDRLGYENPPLAKVDLIPEDKANYRLVVYLVKLT